MDRNQYDAENNQQNGTQNEHDQSNAQYNEYSYNSNNPQGQQGPNSDYFRSSDPYAQHSYYQGYGTYGGGAPRRERQKSSKAGYIVILCISVVLSLVVGSFSGAIASLSFSEPIIDKEPPIADNVITQTTVTINTAKVDHGAIVNATEVAYNSAVTINVYANKEAAAEDVSSGAGSGVIYTADGYIITCNHVVEGYDVIKVTFANGDHYYAETVGTDSQTDLAVIKIDGKDLPACTVREWEKSPITIGESVIAIGNPLGVLGHSVTSGIISGLARSITVEGQNMTLLQTDASINSGNSGGGLFDINGSLIGIVNAKSTGSTIDNLGFAIPIDTAYNIANELIEHGYVTGRPGLNISIVNVTTSNYASVLKNYPELEKHVVKRYTTSPWGGGSQIADIYTGVFVVDASKVQYPEGGKELKYGDRLIQVTAPDGDIIQVDSAQTLSNLIQELKIGDQLTVTVYREGNFLNIPTLLAEKTG